MKELTMEEAGHLWCPMSRLWSDMGTKTATFNRMSGLPVPKDCCCIGDKCAAWCQETMHGGMVTTGRGHCGLCGK